MIFLGIDVGTTSMKAVAVTESGSVVHSFKHEYTERRTSAEGSYLEVGEIAIGLRRLFGSLVESDVRNTPCAVSASVLGEAICAINRESDPVGGQLLLPMDFRGLELYRDFAERVGIDTIQEITGHPFHPMFSLCKILWLLSAAGSSDRPTGFIDALSLVNRLLTGRPLTEPSIAARTQLYDIRTKEWSDRIIRELPFSDLGLPNVGERGEFVGYLRKDFIPNETRRDIPVFLGGFDQACAALGNGVIDANLAMDNVGTTICVGNQQVRYQPDLSLQSMGFQWTPSVVNTEEFFLNAGSLSGGVVLDWCVRLLSSNEVPETAVEQWLLRTDEKPSKLTFLPYLTGASAPFPNPLARASIAGITIDTNALELFSAALDSVNFESRLVLESIEERLGHVERVIVSGSPRRSAKWLQKKADVYGRTVTTTRVAEASAYGAAMIAALGHDTQIVLHSLVPKWCGQEATYEPSSLAREYDAKFRDYAELREANR